jgi:outer membrane protein assembly factor BamB/enterochelin esterase-like enzyme
MCRVLSIALASVIVAGWPVQAQDWPRFRGADSDGRREVPGLFETDFGLSVAWQRPLGSGYSGIVVSAGTLVTMFSDGTSDVVIALDPATGDERWRSIVEPIYRGHDGSHDGAIATPLIAEGRVFALGPWGRFVALDLATGKELWSRHLRDELEVSKPFWGFASSPLFEGGRVLLQVGGKVGTLAAFDPETGRLEWTAGEDDVQYQSPSIGTEGSERLVLVAGGKKIVAVDPRKGEVRWEHIHGGTGNQGAFSLSPVPAGPDAYFLSHSVGMSQVFELDVEGEAPVTEVQWEDRSIRNSYNVPVYHEGHVYAFSSRFLTAVDAADGRTKWKSRTPGDGFLIVVDDHLVISTKTGKVAVGAARPEGFEVAAEVEVFTDLAWTAPTFADGSIFVRSLGEIARVDIVPIKSSETSTAEPVGLIAALAASVAESENPTEAVDRFLEEHPERPILEEGLVHFVYRGEGTDVALGGDLLGARREEPMARLGDTDLFYYTASISPGTRINYVFIRDYEAIVDPGNPRTTTSYFLNSELEPSYGRKTLEMSWVATPPWNAPSHLDPLPETAVRGKLIEHEVTGRPTASAEGVKPAAPLSATLKIWVPADYEKSGKHYPIVYVDGSAALERGNWSLALDHLVGHRIEEIIVVFVDWPGRPLEAYSSFYSETIFPFVDGNYRTEPNVQGRALVGIGPRGLAVLTLALERQDLVGRVGIQSAFVYSPGLGELEAVLGAIEGRNLKIYLDWATYDLRNPYENWDIGAANRRIADALRSRGLPISGGEVADGLGWANWRQRTDDLLEALFPVAGAKTPGEE